MELLPEMKHIGLEPNVIAFNAYGTLVRDEAGGSHVLRRSLTVQRSALARRRSGITAEMEPKELDTNMA